MDAPHDDIGYDPYVASRTYDPCSRGLSGQFRKRWPFYQGRKVVWYRGFVHDHSVWPIARRWSTSPRISGMGLGTVTLTAKDPLKLADNDRAEYPPRSTGVLLDALNSTGTHSH